jgi:hypothetical protein
MAQYPGLGPHQEPALTLIQVPERHLELRRQRLLEPLGNSHATTMTARTRNYGLILRKPFRKILRKPNFTWSEHGEALLRRRKPWYYEQEPRPGISVIGARLSELVSRR